MKFKKAAALFLSLAMAGGMLAGCGGDSASSQPSTNSGANSGSTQAAEPGSEPVTLRFSWWGGDSRHAATQEAIEAFMDKYPNITVKAEFGAWSGWEENVSTQLMSQTAPDLMQINWNWITSYSSDGSSFLDLNTVSDVVDLTQWKQADLDQCTVNGNNLQAVPVALTGRIFYWNKTTFEQAGLETPKTFADLMAAGPVFKEKLGDGYYPMAMGEYDRMIFMVYYLESVYGKPWVTEGKLNYTEAEIKDGLDVLAKMEQEHVIPTLKKIAGDGADSLDKNQNWIDGHYAGIFEWDSSASKFIKAAPESEIVVGEFLSDIGDYQGGFTKVSMAFAISANSEHPREAALLMQFLLGEDEGAKIMASERGVPANQNALKVCTENNLLDANVSEANAKVMEWCQFSLDPLFEDNALKSNPDGVYYKVMAKVSYGELDTAQGAAELVSGITELLNK